MVQSEQPIGLFGVWHGRSQGSAELRSTDFLISIPLSRRAPLSGSHRTADSSVFGVLAKNEGENGLKI